MTQAQRIKKLEAEVADLKVRLAMQEARPFVVTMLAPPRTVAAANLWPGYPTPYCGDWPMNPTTCSGDIGQTTGTKGFKVTQ